MIESWTSPMNRVRWIRAFRARAKGVTLRDGRKFNIKYIDNPFYSGDDKPIDKKVAFASPVLGFAPTGYFRLSKVTDKLWITEGDREDAPPGTYIAYLDEFVANTDLLGVSVVENWPGLEGKKVTTLKAGFSKAKSDRGKRAEGVKVVVDDDTVFLVKESTE